MQNVIDVETSNWHEEKSRFSTWCYLHWYVNKINTNFLRAHDSQGPHINLKSCWFKFLWIQDYWRLQWENCVFNCFILKLSSDGFIAEMHRCMSDCVQYVVQMFCNNCHFLCLLLLSHLYGTKSNVSQWSIEKGTDRWLQALQTKSLVPEEDNSASSHWQTSQRCQSDT